MLTARSGAPLRLMGHFAWPTYLLFGSPWASCSHLVLSNSSQFASFFFVHLPLRFPLTPRITQRVPIPFQHRARAVNPYPIIRFKPMSFFHYFPYITNPFTSSFTLSIDCLSRVIKRDEPKGSIPLAYFISDPSIVLSVCVPVFKEPRSTLFHTSSTKDSSVFNQSRRSRIISVVVCLPSNRVPPPSPRVDPSLSSLSSSCSLCSTSSPPVHRARVGTASLANRKCTLSTPLKNICGAVSVSVGCPKAG